MRTPLPAVAVAVSFIDCINRADVTGLTALMTDDHSRHVFDEPPLFGRAANVEAWGGYFESFPEYVIYPRQVGEHQGLVAVLGHTTGSHLGLADGEESSVTVIWLAKVHAGAVRSWTLIEDTPNHRSRLGLSEDPPQPR